MFLPLTLIYVSSATSSLEGLMLKLALKTEKSLAIYITIIRNSSVWNRNIKLDLLKQ